MSTTGIARELGDIEAALIKGYRTVKACRLCDSSKLSTALDLGETPLANELDGTELFPLIVNRCDDCGHHQLSIAVAPERLWGPNYPYQSGTSPVFRKHLEALADEVAELKPGGRVLEIASNDGTLVRMLAAKGLQVSGVDPSGPTEQGIGYVLEGSAWPPDELAQANGLIAMLDAMRATGAIIASVERLKHDVILALNVFAHVDDLHSFTAAVKEALAPDGVFIVEVGYLPAMLKRGIFDTIYHEHFSYHTAAPLWAFFRKHGLMIVSASENDSQGGTLRLRISHAGLHHSNSLSRITEAETAVDVASLRSIIDARSVALHEAVAQLFKRGDVAIYGAPAKLTTLLYATGLEKLPFVCVGDDNPRKVGRTTPGNHIPIVSVEEMLARKPDTILVASWNFFDDIRDRLRAAGFKGGIINATGGE